MAISPQLPRQRLRSIPARFTSVENCSSPTEPCAIHPRAMHDHSQPTCKRGNDFLPTTPPGHVPCAGFQPRPFFHVGQENLRGFVE